MKSPLPYAATAAGHPVDAPAQLAVATELVIGVTSHRNLRLDEVAGVRNLVGEFFATLRSEFPQLPLIVLSALAQGGDQLVASEALSSGARLIAPLPLPLDMYLNDFADAATRTNFDTLCAQAEVVQLPLLAGQSRLAIGTAGAARDRQYAQAGVYIASHCHILLAIWDGKASGRLGGTAQIANYHLSGTMPGLIDRRRTARHVLGGGDERLLYHIVCSRDGADGAPAAGLLPLQTLWRSGDNTSAADRGLPTDFQLMFARMAEFNVACDKYANDIDSAARERQEAQLDSTVVIDRLFHAADWLAIHFQKRVLLAMRSTYTLAGLMGIALTCFSHLAAQDYLIFVFLLLFASGAFVAVLARHRGWHRKYLDYRALAEGLRIQAYWRRAGVSTGSAHEFAHDNFLQKQNIELGWIRNVMRAASLHPPTGPVQPAPAALASVIAEWVGESGKSGQLHYYERKTVERAGLHRITETVGSISLWGGIGISVFLAVFVFKLSQDTKTLLVTIMAVLSIVAAVREAYAYRKADKELIKQYRFMQRIFTCARAELNRTQDPAEQREILLSLGDAALTEQAEWTLMQRERQVEQGKL